MGPGKTGVQRCLFGRGGRRAISSLFRGPWRTGTNMSTYALRRAAFNGKKIYNAHLYGIRMYEKETRKIYVSTPAHAVHKIESQKSGRCFAPVSPFSSRPSRTSVQTHTRATSTFITRWSWLGNFNNTAAAAFSTVLILFDCFLLLLLFFFSLFFQRSGRLK